jgi:cytochrome c553
MGVLKTVLKGAGIVLGLAVGGVGVFAYVQCSRFDASMDKVYDVPVPTIARSTDPAVLARGKHIAESLGACEASPCHASDLGGGTLIEMGPLGSFAGSNVTVMREAYSDGELARLVKHGVKKDGRSVRFMPAQDISWLPDADVVALVSYMRTVAAVDRPNNPVTVGTLGKVLDRRDQFAWDVARRIDHGKEESVPAPEATPAYGVFLARMCSGCHGEHLSGGPLPGAPSSFAIPLNLTPDATGIKDWELADFDKLMRTGVRKNGKQLDKLMPIEAWKNLDDTEMRALWAYLRTLAPTPFGGR